MSGDTWHQTLEGHRFLTAMHCERGVRRLKGNARLNKSEIKTAVASQLARNRELKKLIASKGVDLETQRAIDLHFWARGELAARNPGVALQAKGCSVVVSDAVVEGTDLWNVEGQVEASPLAVCTPAFIETMVRLASEHQSEFDGWGTSI